MAALLLAVAIVSAAATPAPCQVPRNCGQHNNSVVCGYKFTGCEFVCGKGSDPGNVGCCHANILTDATCNACVDVECKPVPPLPQESYNCVNNQCAKQPWGQGAFANLTDCQQVGHCGVASAWNILQSFVEAMAPNSAATYTLGGKNQYGQCQGFDMGSFGSDSTITVDQGKQLTVTVDTGCLKVVLDASHKGGFFNVGNILTSGSLVLQGVTLRNGEAYGDRGAGVGGGVAVLNGTLRVKDSRFENGKADFGGAIGLCFNGMGSVCTLHATNTTFFNSSGWGSIYTGSGNSTINNCTFIGTVGAAIANVDHYGNMPGIVTITDTHFKDCVGSDSPAGGAVLVWGTATITDSTFTGCSTTDACPGGAVSVGSEGDGKLGTATITNSTFTNCSSPGSPGGAVYIYGNATLTNCIFADNTCGDCGDAYAGGAILNNAAGALVLAGCKFVVPANTRAGNNDLLGAATFACPPGTTGTPVAVAAGPHTIKQLPPSTDIVHCV
jgi:hypothetical protein